ncbi:pyrroloquinoline quinone biosynthesis peptide chaperone PqqD [Actinokineospora enzanensis]|uniref:pyrroloquinoline quinone biosynthesis peptide chaperone PqqD n=1 Tax=Actinokineospora enzanensis TaxID=155975 RepID=UPI0003794D21|nr:pyrroloquinoline quinone biosynthesis peptide chaperone PqqD [Actinokineospora enzanensis]
MNATEWVPRLRRGVRLDFDAVRRSAVALFPEGVLLLNPTAEAVLRACDGTRTVARIVDRLGEHYAGVRVEDVVAVLRGLAERDIVERETT